MKKKIVFMKKEMLIIFGIVLVLCGDLAVCQTGQRTALDTVDFYDDRKYSSGSERP